MNKTLLLFLLLFSSVAFAQQDEAGARACLEHYMSGDADRVERAFHASATMKYIDAASGAFRDVPISEYISRVRANSGQPRQKRTIEIVSMNVEGTAAQAKIRIETDKVVLHDYMNLLKIDGEWKIVSKIFHRSDKQQ